MSIRRFKINVGFFDDLSVTVAVDTSKLTDDLAHEINSFWTGADAVLAAADDDVVQAVARRAAGFFIQSLLEGSNRRGAQADLDTAEGWPPNGEHGITLGDYELPDFSVESYEVEELFEPAESKARDKT